MLKLILALLVGLLLGSPAVQAPRHRRCGPLHPCAVFPVPVQPPAPGLG